MKHLKKGDVAYDTDRYNNRIRKYVVTKMIKVHGKYEPVWTQVDFTPETGFARYDK